MESATDYRGSKEDDDGSWLLSDVKRLNGDVSVYNLYQLCTETRNGVFSEKLMIPREELASFCNATLPLSCSQDASSIHFNKLDGLQHYCYGVVGQRDAISVFLTKTAGLADEELDRFASRAPGIYCVSLRPPGISMTSDIHATDAQPTCANISLLVLWPASDAFTSISPTSTTTACVRYITQLTRHVFFCFDRPGTLALPLGERKRNFRVHAYKLAERVTREELFSLHPGFAMDSELGLKNAQPATTPSLAFGSSTTGGKADPPPTRQPILSRSLITGGSAGVAILEQALQGPGSWAWNEGHTFRFNLTDEAGRPCSAMRDGLQRYRVEIHPDMPAGEVRTFLCALASPDDCLAVDVMLRKLEEKQRSLQQWRDAQIARVRAEWEAAQRRHEQAKASHEVGVLRAFHSMLASQTHYPESLPPHVETDDGLVAQFLADLGAEERAAMVACLGDHVRDVESVIGAVVARCCMLGVLAREVRAGDEEAWLRSHMDQSDEYLKEQVARVGQGAAMDVQFRVALGYPFHEPEQAAQGSTGPGPHGDAEPLSQGAGWEGGSTPGISSWKSLGSWARRLLGRGGSAPAWTPDGTRARLLAWAREHVAKALGNREAQLKREIMTSGPLGLPSAHDLRLPSPLHGTLEELCAQVEESCRKAEESCVAALSQLILPPATSEPLNKDDRQAIRVRRCVIVPYSSVSAQEAAGALPRATSVGKTHQLEVTADLQQPRGPRLELTVSLMSAPQKDDACGTSGASGNPQVIGDRGKAYIPTGWSLLAAFLVNEGRWLLTVANTPSHTTAVTIHKLMGEGQHFTKSFGKPAVLADFDEVTRLLAFYTTIAGRNTVCLYRFDERFSSVEPACPPLELASFSGSEELRDMKLLKSQPKLVMLDAGGRVRAYNVQQRAMEREMYQAPALGELGGNMGRISGGVFPTSLLTTARGTFILAVVRDVPEVTSASSQRGSLGGSSATTVETLRITPLTVPGLRALPEQEVEVAHPGGACSLATFRLGVGKQGTANEYLGVLHADTGALTTHVIQAQGREEADRIEAVEPAQGDANNASELCMLEYVFHAYDKFAVAGAAGAHEETWRDAAMHLAVVLDHEEGEDARDSLRERVRRYVHGIERRLQEGYKPGVETLSLSRNLVVLSSAALDASWLAGLQGTGPSAIRSSLDAPRSRGTTLLAAGGSPLDEPRHLWLLSAEPFQVGPWVRDLICLLPLQIARAEDNAFVLMADGMPLKAHPRSTEEAVGTVRFGLLDAVLESWHGDVVVVSSMGQQGTGKSYTLNHLFGTSFQVSGTDGCWMGLRQVGGVMYVILDFEGLGSFERTEQEDMLLAVFNAAVSNYTLFKVEFRLDRYLEAMFSRFQSGMGLLKGDERLFQGCFCIVVKDVAERDVRSVYQEFNTKIALIMRPREGPDDPDNFINEMYNGEFAVFPFPPLGRPEFYSDLGAIFQTIAERPRQFTSGGVSFLSFMKQVMSKLVMKDWTTVEGQDVLHRVQYLARHLDAAISHGRLSVYQGASESALEEGALISLDTGQMIESCELAVTLPVRQRVGIPVVQVPDPLIVLRGRDREALIQQLLEVFCKDVEVERPQWEATFLAFVKAVVDRRCARVQEWVELNLSRLRGEGGRLEGCAVRIMDEVASKLQALRNEWQLCGSSCSHCFMSCLLPKSHPTADHTCMGTHACQSTCWFCEETLEDPSANSVLHSCAEKMGHGGAHCCKQKPHTCQGPCDMAGFLNCKRTCGKKAGHEHLPGGGGHICSSLAHLCGAPCSASGCHGACQIRADKTHTVHKCADVICLQGCAVGGCTYTCSARDHFHHTPFSQQYLAEAGGIGKTTVGQGAAETDCGLHFCGHEHPCSEQCESEGICRLSIQRVSEDVVGTGSTFTYNTAMEVTGTREKCAIRIPPFKLHHEGPHTHSLDPRVVHTCSAKCPTCLFFCELPFGHAGNHKSAHGRMRTESWVPDHDGLDVGDRKYVTGESGQAEMCNLGCQSLGRGHIHILPCDADDPDQCTYSACDGRRHETRRYGPDEDLPKDELTHAIYWETIGWHDNCSVAERELFAKCSHRCGAPEHEEGCGPPVFCELELWHEPADRASAGEGQSVSRDGHLFACKHHRAAGSGHHIVFALDSSRSMGGQPWQDLLWEVTGFLAQRVSTGGQDLVSVIVYDNFATIVCEGIPIANCSVSSLHVCNGDANFAAALTKAGEVIARVHSREGGIYTPVLLFMSNGQDNTGTTEMKQLRTRFGPDGLIVYMVGFGSSDFSMLRSLAWTGQGTFENSVDGIALVNTFGQIASSTAQKASLLQRKSKSFPEFMATVPQPFSIGLIAGLECMARGNMREASRLFERAHALDASNKKHRITDALLLLLVCRTKLNDDGDAGVKAEAAKLMETWDGFSHLTVTELFGIAALLDYLPGNSARVKAAHSYAKLFLDMDCGPEAFWLWFKERAREIVDRTAPVLGARAGTGASKPQPAALTVATRWQKIVAKDSSIAIPAMEQLLQMTGLEPVKEQFLGIFHWVCIAKRRGESLHGRQYNVWLEGNPGTGKATVARLYGSFLASLGVLSGAAVQETSGTKLVQGGVDELMKLLEEIETKGGGVLLIDEAHQLNPGKCMDGRRVLDYLLAQMDNKVGTLVVALAGYKSKMEASFKHNQGLPERFPYKFAFKDYDDSDLKDMLQKRIVKKIPSPNLTIEGGMDGKPMRILIRRLGQGRGREGFGNAHAVANLWDRIMVRQEARIASEMAKGIRCNVYEFKREDLLGPNVRLALNNSAAYRALQGMVGLKEVKAAVDGMVKVIETNAEREEREEPLLRMSLNRLFLGTPGVGKTTVAKHYAGILKDLGLLSKGEVIIKNPSDFIGGHLGQSEEKTTGILKSAAGNVLVIDEAYGLFSSVFSGSGQDPYKESVIDTIVAKVPNVPGEDLAVLMLGYQAQMEEFLTKANPGLARMFALKDAFVFEGYMDDELLMILNDLLAKKGLQADFHAKRAAVEHLAKQRRRPNFGNAGAVEHLISSAIMRMNARLGSMSPVERGRVQELTAEDFDLDLAPVSCGDLSSVFADLVGCEAAKNKLAEYTAIVEQAHKRGVDPLQNLSLCFRFVGGPGTGKMTVARKMGANFKSLGLLGKGGVIEVSATELLGLSVGMSGPKTRDMLREALGCVLFISEAYRLEPDHSSFASEALNEIVDALAEPEFRNKLMVVLAGFPREVHEQSNPVMSRLFKEIVEFEDFTPEQCLAVLKVKLKGAYVLPAGTDEEITAHFASLMKVAGWANGRDVESLLKDFQKRAMRRIMALNVDVRAGGIIQLERDDVFPALELLLHERTACGPVAHQSPQEARQGSLGPAHASTSSRQASEEDAGGRDRGAYGSSYKGIHSKADVVFQVTDADAPFAQPSTGQTARAGFQPQEKPASSPSVVSAPSQTHVPDDATISGSDAKHPSHHPSYPPVRVRLCFLDGRTWQEVPVDERGQVEAAYGGARYMFKGIVAGDNLPTLALRTESRLGDRLLGPMLEGEADEAAGPGQASLHAHGWVFECSLAWPGKRTTAMALPQDGILPEMELPREAGQHNIWVEVRTRWERGAPGDTGSLSGKGPGNSQEFKVVKAVWLSAIVEAGPHAKWSVASILDPAPPTLEPTLSTQLKQKGTLGRIRSGPDMRYRHSYNSFFRRFQRSIIIHENKPTPGTQGAGADAVRRNAPPQLFLGQPLSQSRLGFVALDRFDNPVVVQEAPSLRVVPRDGGGARGQEAVVFLAKDLRTRQGSVDGDEDDEVTPIGTPGHPEQSQPPTDEFLRVMDTLPGSYLRKVAATDDRGQPSDCFCVCSDSDVYLHQQDSRPAYSSTSSASSSSAGSSPSQRYALEVASSGDSDVSSRVDVDIVRQGVAPKCFIRIHGMPDYHLLSWQRIEGSWGEVLVAMGPGYDPMRVNTNRIPWLCLEATSPGLHLHAAMEVPPPIDAEHAPLEAEGDSPGALVAPWSENGTYFFPPLLTVRAAEAPVSEAGEDASMAARAKVEGPGVIHPEEALLKFSWRLNPDLVTRVVVQMAGAGVAARPTPGVGSELPPFEVMLEGEDGVPRDATLNDAAALRVTLVLPGVPGRVIRLKPRADNAFTEKVSFVPERTLRLEDAGTYKVVARWRNTINPDRRSDVTGDCSLKVAQGGAPAKLVAPDWEPDQTFDNVDRTQLVSSPLKVYCIDR
eukprot:jgi/Mesvir1/3449/Mv11943-RA.1